MRITLATWQALGDTVVSLPVAFHLEAQGHEVAIVNTRGNGLAEVTQYADRIPTYPRFRSCPWGRVIQLQRANQEPDPVRGVIEETTPIDLPVAYGRVVDVTRGAPFGWSSKSSLFDGIAANARAVLEDTPRVPILARPREYKARAEELTGSADPYVLVAVEGSRPDRAMTQEQVSAVANMARTVLVHHKRREYQADALNLTGSTTLEDLFALIAHATAVVSVDTGAWHIAPAMMTPTLGLVSDTSAPEALVGYKPAVYLRCLRGLQFIPPELVTQALERMILSRPLTSSRRAAIGLRWWESGEVQCRLANAASHQARLTAALGSNIIEVP